MKNTMIKITAQILCLGYLAILMSGCAATQPVPWVSTPQYDVEYDLAWELTTGLLEEQF